MVAEADDPADVVDAVVDDVAPTVAEVEVEEVLVNELELAAEEDDADSQLAATPVELVHPSGIAAGPLATILMVAHW